MKKKIPGLVAWFDYYVLAFNFSLTECLALFELLYYKLLAMFGLGG